MMKASDMHARLPVRTSHLPNHFLFSATLTVFMLILLSGLAGGTITQGGDDTTTRRSGEFTYRTVCIMYDSVAICCSFGEASLPTEHDRMIEQVHYMPDPVNVETSMMAQVCRSKPFHINQLTQFSIWRGLHLQQDGILFHYKLPDTCSFVLRLHNAKTNQALCTLDSTGFLPGSITEWGEFPAMFGLTNSHKRSHGTLKYDLAEFSNRGVDEVYVTVSVVIQGHSNAACTLKDISQPERISDMLGH